MRYAVRGGFPCKFWKKKDARFILRPLFSSISSVSTHPRATEWNWSDNGNDGNDNEDDDSRDWLKEEKKFTTIFFEFFFSNLGRSDRLLVDKLEKCQNKFFFEKFFFWKSLLVDGDNGDNDDGNDDNDDAHDNTMRPVGIRSYIKFFMEILFSLLC